MHGGPASEAIRGPIDQAAATGPVAVDPSRTHSPMRCHDCRIVIIDRWAATLSGMQQLAVSGFP
jgi:hypothetical protein